jgi:proline dehydrogenase
VSLFRNFFLFLSTNSKVRGWMETSSGARRLTERFIAGLTLEDELAVCTRLEQEGMFSALDHLGENVTRLEEADHARDSYLEALAAIEARKLPASISLKLTQLGLDLSEDACIENLRVLARRAEEIGTRVEVDMEGSPYTDVTFRIVEKVAAEFPVMRLAIQVYLYRTPADIERFNRLGISVRLCKGAYREPADIAMPDKRDVDSGYVTLMKVLLDQGTYPALGTHDEHIIAEALRYVREKKIPAERFEFEMLHGIRRDLQKLVVKEGCRLRVYVPYGAAWYPYFMRRLAERPANALFLAKNMLRR